MLFQDLSIASAMHFSNQKNKIKQTNHLSLSFQFLPLLGQLIDDDQNAAMLSIISSHTLSLQCAKHKESHFKVTIRADTVIHYEQFIQINLLLSPVCQSDFCKYTWFFF